MSQQQQYARTYRNNITNTRLFNLTGVNSEGTLGFLSVEVSGNGVKVSILVSPMTNSVNVKPSLLVLKVKPLTAS